MFGVLWLVTRLPWHLQMRIGSGIGWLALRLARHRRHITRVNLDLCFPELDKHQRQALLEQHFRSLGQGIVETAMCWWGREKQLEKLFTITGEHYLQDALSAGRGVILLSAHFTTLEIGGRLLAMAQPFHVLYRPHKNALFEAVMHKSRTRRFEKAIPRNDTRSLLRSLKENGIVWFAPDQDHGLKHSVFAPFFGIQVATLSTTSRLAEISSAPVVPFFPYRLPQDRGYLLCLCPALTDFPTGDARADASRINQLIEQVIREMPDQYLWAHRRFKTRPDGEQNPYD